MRLKDGAIEFGFELRVVIGPVGISDVAFPEVGCGLVACGFNLIHELAPSLTQAFIRAGVESAYDFGGGQFTGFGTAHGPQGRADRHADLEVEDAGRHIEVMSKDRPRRPHALRTRGGDDLCDGRPHEGLDLVTWAGDVNDSGRLGLGLQDREWREHDRGRFSAI